MGQVTQRDVLGLSFVIFVACLLRLAAPQGMAVEHFDEGVYASNIWSPVTPVEGGSGGGYPLRHFYAPPLLPFLIEMSILMTGTQLGPLLPNLIIGSGTIALVWIVTRSWCGAGIAWPAAILAATNDVHMLYSRTALTDVLLSAAMLLAVWLISIAVAYRRIDIGVLAGLATTVAWWTKYNGWLPLAIALGGIVFWMWRDPAARANVKKSLSVVSVMIATAVLGWLPFLWSLQAFPGGYSSVSANHASYLVGFPGWFTSFTQQLQTLREMDSLVGVAGACIAAAVTIRNVRQRGRSGGALLVLGTVTLVGVVTYLGGSGALLAAGSLFFCGYAYQGYRSEISPSAEQTAARRRCQQVGWCLLAVWLLGLSLTIPLYTPYPRLTVAWFLPAWIATATTFQLASSALPDVTERSPSRRSAGILAAVLLFASAGAAFWQTGRGHTKLVPTAWERRTGVSQVAAAVLEDIRQAVPQNKRTLIFVCGEPALYYHINAGLARQGRPIACLPIAQPAFDDKTIPPDVATFVVVGPFARTTDGYAAAFAHRSLQPVAEHTCQVSTLMTANLAAPAQWDAYRQQLYEVYRWQRP